MQTNTAVVEPTVENMKKRNQTSAADRIRSYLRHPGSGVLALSYDRGGNSYLCSIAFSGSIYPGKRYPVSDTGSFQSGIYIRKCIADAITDQYLYHDSAYRW